MRADNKKVATVTPGRESVRLVSNDLFGDGVYIFDVDHIPLGCGTVSFLFVLRPRARPQFLQWPAAWTTTIKQWPWGGEIDVLEGANALGNNSIPAVFQTQPQPHPNTSTLSTSPSTTAGGSSPQPSSTHESVNVVSLHTGSNCYISAANTSALTTMTGTVDNTDCSGLSEGNVGCGVKIPGPSYGLNFNNVGGGVYAMWRDLQRYVRLAPRLNNLDRILTRIVLCPAPARYAPGSGPGISIPLRMSRLVIFTFFFLLEYV